MPTLSGLPQQSWGVPQQGYGPPAPVVPVVVAKKSNTGLIVGILLAVVLIPLLCVGLFVLSGILGLASITKTLQNAETPGSAGTFQTYTGATYSINYPSNWQVDPYDDPSVGNQSVTFTDPSRYQGTQGLEIDTWPNAGDAARIARDACIESGPQIAGPSPVTVGGQQWMRSEWKGTGYECVAEYVTYKGREYILSYISSLGSFFGYQQQYYMPMEQSFKFLS